MNGKRARFVCVRSGEHSGLSAEVLGAEIEPGAIVICAVLRDALARRGPRGARSSLVLHTFGSDREARRSGFHVSRAGEFVLLFAPMRLTCARRALSTSSATNSAEPEP